MIINFLAAMVYTEVDPNVKTQNWAVLSYPHLLIFGRFRESLVSHRADGFPEMGDVY